MAQCKICLKEYHACSSCGLEWWEYDYCSESCFLKTVEGKWEFTKTIIDNSEDDELIAMATAAILLAMRDKNLPIPDWAEELIA